MSLTSVTIVRFRAGAHSYGIAAGCVLNIAAARPDVPHLAWLLLGGLSEFASGARTLQIASNGRSGDVMVDGPIEVIELESSDIAPCRTTTSSITLGFVRRDGGVFALLDAERVVDLLRDSTNGQTPETTHEDPG